jgi:hypothetical protein
MDSLKPLLPKISDKDRTQLTDVLLEFIAWQQVQIDNLEQEILKLKGETTKPKIKPMMNVTSPFVRSSGRRLSLKKWWIFSTRWVWINRISVFWTKTF